MNYHTYKGVKFIKPNDISLKFIKRLIDNLGGDYSFSIESLIDFLSKNKVTYVAQAGEHSCNRGGSLVRIQP